MNIQELSTALQFGLPVLVLNLNNRFLGMVKQWQDMVYHGRHSHSYMESLPDFVRRQRLTGMSVSVSVIKPRCVNSLRRHCALSAKRNDWCSPM